MLFAKSNKLLIEGRGNCVEIFSYQPDNIETAPLGQLYLLGELSRSFARQNTVFLLNAVASILKRTYYLHPQQGPEKRLETALKAVNNNLSRLTDNAESEKIAKHLHLCALVISPTHLYFSKTKGTGIFLLRQESWLNIGANHQSPSLTKSQKLFQNIIRGRLQKDDQIFVTTPLVISYMHQQTFRSHLVEPNLNNAKNQLQRMLHSANPQAGAALLRLSVQKEPTTKTPLKTIPLHLAAANTQTAHQPATPKLADQQSLLKKQQALFPDFLKSAQAPKTQIKTYSLKLKRIFKQLKADRLLQKFYYLAKKPVIIALVGLLLLLGLGLAGANLLNLTGRPPSPQELLAELPKTQKLPEPQTVLDFSQLSLEFDPFELFYLPDPSDTLISLGATTIYRFSLEPSSSRFIFLPSSILPANSGTLAEGNLILLKSSPPSAIEALNLQEESFHAIEASLPGTPLQTAFFQNALYYLIKDSFNIYQQESPFQNNQLTQWNQVDLKKIFSQISDFQINGSMWITGESLSGGALLVELKQGRLSRQIELDKLITVPVQSSDKLTLTTNEQTSDLFILDPGLSRIIQINKISQQLQAQLTHPSLANAIDITLAPQANQLFVLTAEKVLAISVP